jgi:hypothetical protein
LRGPPLTPRRAEDGPAPEVLLLFLLSLIMLMLTLMMSMLIPMLYPLLFLFYFFFSFFLSRLLWSLRSLRRCGPEPCPDARA